ncbi:MAG: hypothetical protein NT020_05480, partial [Chloroflexales bacterium]|nr:hypothetical protein [Chloroflexales bacterium]
MNRFISFPKIITAAAVVIISILSYHVVAASHTRSMPVAVPDIVVGTDFSCALDDSGTVWCWGDNTYGQLGDGTTTPSSEPVQVTGLSGVQSFSAGSTHVCAIDGSNAVWCWGHNDHGQLGTNNILDSSSPIQVSGTDLNANVVQVSAGA